MENFADIEGPVRIGLMTYLIWGVAILVALALLLFLLNRFARRQARVGDPATVPTQSPFEVAIGRLRSLRSSQSALEAEPFTVEVTDIVRDYLEESLEIPAREQTSEEFLVALQQRNDLPSALHASMPAFLEQCDQVKFARQSLAEGQRESLLDTAGSVVEDTDAHIRARQAPEETVHAS